MFERSTTRYRRLFEVRLLHHYWLDEGATVFDLIADAAKRDRRLAAYDRRRFLDVFPTAATADALAGSSLIFKETALGFLVAAPDDAKFADDAAFEFVVVPSAGNLFDYTALTFRQQTVHEIADPADVEIVHRFKENVPVLSNLTGTRRGAGANARLFLSQPTPAADPTDMVEALIAAGGALQQLTSDNPGATTRVLAADATQVPVYLHQGDAPAIVPPPGVAGVPARGIALTDGLPDAIFALITLIAVRDDDAAFSFVTAAGAPKAAAPVYEVCFRNRSTVWTYLDKATGAPVSQEPDALPLTWFGNAGDKRKPTEGTVKAVFAGQKVTRLVSEIYV